MSTLFERDVERDVDRLLRQWGVRPAQPEGVEVRKWPGRETFADVLGQDEVLTLLRLEIAAAKREGRRLADLLFVGPPGTGKTLLAAATANEAGRVIYLVSGPELTTVDAALRSLVGCGRLHEATGRPVALVIDEVDAIPRQVSYVFHSLMLTGTVPWRGQLYGGCPVSILASSNRLAKVPPAMRSRFAEVLMVDYYEVADLTCIVEREAVRKDLTLAEGVARFLAENSGGEPRKAGHLVRSLRNVLNADAATMEYAKTALRLSGLRPLGLSRLQVRYLETLASTPDGTMGLNSLAGVLGTDAAEITGAVEPFLLRSQLAQVTRSGRQLTDRGKAYLRARGQV